MNKELVQVDDYEVLDMLVKNMQTARVIATDRDWETDLHT